MTAERRLRQRPTETTVTKPPGWVSELPHEHTHLLASGGAEGLNIYTKGDVRSAASKDIRAASKDIHR